VSTPNGQSGPPVQRKAQSMYSEAMMQEWGFLLDLYESGKPYRQKVKD